MREAGRELGVAPMAVCHWAPSKNEPLTLLDRVPSIPGGDRQHPSAEPSVTHHAIALNCYK